MRERERESSKDFTQTHDFLAGEGATAAPPPDALYSCMVF